MSEKKKDQKRKEIDLLQKEVGNLKVGLGKCYLPKKKPTKNTE